MARAFVSRIANADAEGDTINVELTTIYYGADVPTPLVNIPVNFIVTGTDTLAQMAAKATTAVVDRGAQLGLSVARTQVVMPSLVRGS